MRWAAIGAVAIALSIWAAIHWASGRGPTRVVPVDECHMQIKADCQIQLTCGELPRVLPIFRCLAEAAKHTAESDAGIQ